MVQSDNERLNHKPLFMTHDDYHPKRGAVAFFNHPSTSFLSSSMRKIVRALFSALLLLVVALSCGFAVRSEFGTVYSFSAVSKDGDDSSLTREPSRALDFPLFNSTLLKLSEIEVGEQRTKMEIQQLLQGNLVSPSLYKGHFMSWFRARNVQFRARMSRGNAINLRLPEFSRVWLGFRMSLSDWARKKGFHSDIMSELVDLIRSPIDRYKGLEVSRRRYSSCAVVGNSGILLNNDHGELIDSHEVVIRLNNARIDAYKRHLGSKTSVSFINSNILHLCSRRDTCPCYPYGEDVPIVIYICQPVHFLDYTICNSSRRAPLIVTDPRFDVLVSRLIKYYSLKRFAAGGPNKTLDQWSAAHDNAMFHYSSGMQAVMLALGTCIRVSIFGFGKSPSAKHHYHTSQKAELSLHDYEAEYDFYQDLVEKPQVIPFISSKFRFPPVVIYR